jgi:hypothetical protein
MFNNNNVLYTDRIRPPTVVIITVTYTTHTCGHYRCEGIPPDPDKSFLPPKNTMILYVKEMIHFFIYYYDIANYDGGLRSQISNQLPLILCLIRQP